MEPSDVQQNIRELKKLQTQKRLWQLGITVALLVVVLACVLKVRNAVYGLTQPGPTQQAFVTDLDTRLQQNVLPTVQEMGTQALRQVDYQAELNKLNARTPEIAQASLQQMRLLSNDLAQRGKKVFDTTLQTALKQRQSKIKTLFPDATDEQVSSFMTNFTNEAGQQMADINDALFTRHQKALNGIVENITRIQNEEAPHIQKEPPTWAMALLIFDVAREDLKGLEPAEIKVESATPKSGKTPAQAKEIKS
jgi:hypothetical protein